MEGTLVFPDLIDRSTRGEHKIVNGLFGHNPVYVNSADTGREKRFGDKYSFFFIFCGKYHGLITTVHGRHHFLRYLDKEVMDVLCHITTERKQIG